MAHCEGSRFQGAHLVLLGVDCPTPLQVGTRGTLGHRSSRTTKTVFLKKKAHKKGVKQQGPQSSEDGARSHAFEDAVVVPPNRRFHPAKEIMAPIESFVPTLDLWGV